MNRITIPQCRKLRETAHDLGAFLTDEEYTEIMQVFARAINRLEQEGEEE